MSNEISRIPETGSNRDWTEQQAALMEFAGLVKTQMNGGVATKVPVPRPVIEAFLAACHRTQLDPIARQIYAIELGGKYTVMVSIDGLRVVAQRTGKYRGALSTEWTADGVTWLPVWLSAEAPAAARVRVVHADFAQPLDGIATWKEFGKTTATWKAMPAHMLAKVAESLALRRAFPMELSGLYTPEEIDHAEPIEPTRDWLAEMKQIDNRADLAKLFKELKDAQEWTPALHEEFGIYGGSLPAEDVPAGAPGNTGDPELDEKTGGQIVDAEPVEDATVSAGDIEAMSDEEFEAYKATLLAKKREEVDA